MGDRLITLLECAELMGVSRSKAYRLARARKAPFENVEKYGSTYMVPYLAFCRRLGLDTGEGRTDDEEASHDTR